VSFEDLPTALPTLLGPGGAAMCQVVSYS
jgi:hypothetical protein